MPPTKLMEVQPLDNLDALLTWDGPEPDLEKVLDSLAKLEPKSPSIQLPVTTSSPFHYKTLVCHDMKGGYLDDRFVNGTKNEESYRFYHWSGIDIFVYFSHKFITIPPCGWVEAAHIHGVKVLGTVITEWDHGTSIWTEILNDKIKQEIIINNLVNIAHAYKFEGWLLNIENKIKPEQINQLLVFIEELRRKMHDRIPHAEVIWYDSVTVKGDLKWQNKLNHLNQQFFDVCDGIFLNYTWNEDGLIHSVAMAGQRLNDVYVGVDIYGRNFYQGGGYNSHKALQLIRKYNFSAAIFAQGWTYESLGGENYFSNENRLWLSLRPYLLYHGPTRLPIVTSFCQGFGKNKYRDGKVIEDRSWYNLSKQRIQPIWEELGGQPDSHTSLSTDLSFNGGSCVVFWIAENVKLKLLVCRVLILHSLEITLTYKETGAFKNIALDLTFDWPSSSDLGNGNATTRNVSFICESGKEKNTSLEVEGNASSEVEGNASSKVENASSEEKNASSEVEGNASSEVENASSKVENASSEEKNASTEVEGNASSEVENASSKEKNTSSKVEGNASSEVEGNASSEEEGNASSEVEGNGASEVEKNKLYESRDHSEIHGWKVRKFYLPAKIFLNAYIRDISLLGQGAGLIFLGQISIKECLEETSR